MDEGDSMSKIRVLPRGETLNYWCSWHSQGVIAKKGGSVSDEIKFGGDQGINGARDVLNEHNVFGSGGFAEQWPPEIRKHLFLMLDDGWDVDYDSLQPPCSERYGSLILSRTKFPSFTGSNGERLKQLNERVKQLGWRGIGVWVAAQPCAPLYNEDYNEASLTEYYTERILESKYAGVRYWKVDWGKYCDSLQFRKLLTELRHKLYPKLYIEHARVCNPVNGILESGLYRFADDKRIYEEYAAIHAISDVFRTYDVTDNYLSVSTTLDRVNAALVGEGGFVNCEDEVYIGAALGLSLGIMRSKYGSGENSNRLSEAVAAVRWQSESAPPFACGEIKASDEVLTDTHTFEKGETWYSPVIGKTVSQAAPHIMARNTTLPVVTGAGENAPYIVASKNPSGAYSIAAIGRCRSKGMLDEPNVVCDIGDARKIGIFGSFGEIRFNAKNVRAMKARCLITNNETDVTNMISIENNAVVITDKTMASICKPIDNSERAIELTLSRG